MTKKLMREIDCEKCAAEKGAIFERVDYTIDYKEFLDGWLLKVQEVDLEKHNIWLLSCEVPSDVVRWITEWLARDDYAVPQTIMQGEPGAYKIIEAE